jgi:hypothetical protein
MAVVEAQITKVEKDETTGWYTIHTDDSVVKKLGTKQESPAKAAAALRRDGTRAKLTYKENEREVGDRTYKNFWLDKAEAAPTNGASADDDGIERVAATGRKTDPGDAWRMCLNKGGELAVGTMPMMPVEQRDFDTQKRIAIAWARFFFFTPPPSADEPAFASTAAGHGPGAYQEPDSYETPPPPSDDDIPF